MSCLSVLAASSVTISTEPSRSHHDSCVAQVVADRGPSSSHPLTDLAEGEPGLVEQPGLGRGLLGPACVLRNACPSQVSEDGGPADAVLLSEVQDPDAGLVVLNKTLCLFGTQPRRLDLPSPARGGDPPIVHRRIGIRTVLPLGLGPRMPHQ